MKPLRAIPLHTRMLVGGLVGAGGGLASHMLLRDDPGLATFIRYVAAKPEGDEVEFPALRRLPERLVR